MFRGVLENRGINNYNLLITRRLIIYTREEEHHGRKEDILHHDTDLLSVGQSAYRTLLFDSRMRCYRENEANAGL